MDEAAACRLIHLIPWPPDPETDPNPETKRETPSIAEIDGMSTSAAQNIYSGSFSTIRGPICPSISNFDE